MTIEKDHDEYNYEDERVLKTCIDVLINLLIM